MSTRLFNPISELQKYNSLISSIESNIRHISSRKHARAASHSQTAAGSSDWVPSGLLSSLLSSLLPLLSSELENLLRLSLAPIMKEIEDVRKGLRQCLEVAARNRRATRDRLTPPSRKIEHTSNKQEHSNPPQRKGAVIQKVTQHGECVRDFEEVLREESKMLPRYMSSSSLFENIAIPESIKPKEKNVVKRRKSKGVKSTGRKRLNISLMR